MLGEKTCTINSRLDPKRLNEDKTGSNPMENMPGLRSVSSENTRPIFVKFENQIMI